VGPGKSGAEFLSDLAKKGRKEAELFSSLVLQYKKKVIFSAENCNSCSYTGTGTQFFPTILQSETLKKPTTACMSIPIL
jgi:hypothetical protein